MIMFPFQIHQRRYNESRSYNKGLYGNLTVRNLEVTVTILVDLHDWSKNTLPNNFTIILRVYFCLFCLNDLTD